MKLPSIHRCLLDEQTFELMQGKHGEHARGTAHYTGT
jgi:hypothetical protein